MATKQAAKKPLIKKPAAKKVARKRPSKKAKPRQTKQRMGCLAWLFILLLVLVIAVAALYKFSSFKTRAKIEHTAMNSINVIRTHPSAPSPIAALFDSFYDAIPSSRGLIVEGGDLGRDGSNWIAGIPQSRRQLKLLKRQSYQNLFDQKTQQAGCIALRLTADTETNEASKTAPLTDTETPQLKANNMQMANWSPYPLVPTTVGNEARLISNYAPMTAAYADGPWAKAIETLSQRYPKRFGEIWLYIGPAYRKESSQLPNGTVIPDAFYLIAFDITEAGGLRAMALFIPTVAESENLNDYLTSIEQIETLTGISFIPELDYSLRGILTKHVSPAVW